MSLIRSGVTPVGVWVGDIEADRVYLGDIMIWEKGQPNLVLPSPARAAATAVAPALSAGHVLQVPPATATAQTVAPAVSVVVLPPPAAAVATALPAKVRNGATLDVPPATAAAGVWPPEMRLTTGVVAVPAEATATALPPTIQAGTTLAVPAATATAETVAPLLLVRLDVPAATATAQGVAPVVAIGATITAVAATATATALPPTVKIGLQLADDFNRADGALGASWAAASTALVIATNRAQAGTPAFNSTVVYGARHTTALATDTQEVTGVLVAATAGASSSLSGGVFLRSTTSDTRVEAVAISGTVQILTFISGTRTQRAQATGIGVPTSIRMTAVGNLYSVYINGAGTAAVTWTDSGALISIGASNRSVGMVTVAQDSFGNVTRGYALDSWTAQDL